MKGIKKLIAVVMAAAMLTLLPNVNMLKANAAEAVTYAVKYMPNVGKWCYQEKTSTFDEKVPYMEVDSLRQLIKDGDLVVVYNDSDDAKSLDLGKVNLSNLTYAQNTKWSMVYAGSVRDCYVLGGTAGTVNCYVENAYLYDTVTFNFNSNVNNMIIYGGDKISSSIGTMGTVGHMSAYDAAENRVFNFYDFQAGVFYLENGIFRPRINMGSYKTEPEHMASQSTASQPTASQSPVKPLDSSSLASAKAGETVNVSVDSSFNIPVATQKQVVDKKVTLACHVSGTGLTLTLSNSDVKKPKEDLVFQVTTQADIPVAALNEVTNGSLKNVVVNIGEKKFFSQTLNLHVALGAESAGKVATMYSYDEQTGKMRYEGKFVANENGQAVFQLLRGDEYVIVVTQSTSSTQATANTKNYVVVSGDSLSKIAARNSVSLGSLLKANPQIRNENRIYPGDVLVIPSR